MLKTTETRLIKTNGRRLGLVQMTYSYIHEVTCDDRMYIYGRIEDSLVR